MAWLFRKPKSSEELPEFMRKRWIKQLSDGIQLTAVGCCVYLSPEVKRHYGHDQQLSDTLTAAVVWAPFVEPQQPAAVQVIAREYREFVEALAHRLHQIEPIAPTLAMAVRENIFLRALERAADLGEYTINASEALERYQLPVVGNLEAPGDFLARAIRLVKAVDPQAPR